MVVKSLLLYPLSGLLLLSTLLSFAAEDKKENTPVPAPEPRVSIEPRVRPAKEPEDPAARRETSIRVETQLVLINVTVTDHVETQLVLINVTVTDPMNRFVTGLEKEHFKLLEEKVEQTITQFSS